jgi:hypothetical protein
MQHVDAYSVVFSKQSSLLDDFETQINFAQTVLID